MLRDQFHRLFLISNLKEAKVDEMVRWEGGQLRFAWQWRSPFFLWEKEMFSVL